MNSVTIPEDMNEIFGLLIYRTSLKVVSEQISGLLELPPLQT